MKQLVISFYLGSQHKLSIKLENYLQAQNTFIGKKNKIMILPVYKICKSYGKKLSLPKFAATFFR